MEIHHIVPRSQGGEDKEENAIPLCFDCHAEVVAYNTKHPKGRPFLASELKKHKKQWLNACARALPHPACGQGSYDDSPTVFDLTRYPAHLEPTKLINFFEIKELELMALRLALSRRSKSTDMISLQFVSDKWGFRFRFRAPWDMKCGTLTETFVKGLRLQDHLEIDRVFERVRIIWQIGCDRTGLCAGSRTLRDAGIKEGDIVFLQGTVVSFHVKYAPGRVAGFYFPMENENWRA